jgi:hypothetical protein
MRIHTGLNLHHCQVCGKGFVNGRSLNDHMRTHKGVRFSVGTVAKVLLMLKV